MARDDRTYMKVHDGMPDHPKIAHVGGDAGWLNICAMAYCSRNLTDGRFPASVLARLSDRKAPARLAARLVVAQLWHDHTHPCATGRCHPADPGEYVIHDYTEHQRTAGEVADFKAKKRDAAERGNHQRWHVDRGTYDPGCRFCIAEASHSQSQMGSQVESQEGSQIDSQTHRETSPETETEGEVVRGESPDPATRAPKAPPNGQGPPKRRCTTHADLPDDARVPNCGTCADLRRTAEAADAAARRAAAAAASTEARRRAQAAAQAIATCPLCDNTGYRGNSPCDHDPGRAERSAAGAAAARAALEARTRQEAAS